MVKRRVRAKNFDQAMGRARRKYPSMTVTKINLIQGARLYKGEKLYQVVAHKRRLKKR